VSSEARERTEQSCLDCHREQVTVNVLFGLGGRFEAMNGKILKIGSPLGVVLYAYQRQTK
jgi:hypothetical protein